MFSKEEAEHLEREEQKEREKSKEDEIGSRRSILVEQKGEKKTKKNDHQSKTSNFFLSHGGPTIHTHIHVFQHGWAHQCLFFFLFPFFFPRDASWRSLNLLPVVSFWFSRSFCSFCFRYSDCSLGKLSSCHLSIIKYTKGEWFSLMHWAFT